MSSPRLTAARMLQDILEKKLFLSDVRFHLDSLKGQDTAFANMLVLTALRHLYSIKKLLKKYVKKKLPTKAKTGEYLLILATVEILYLNTPSYAVLNSYVELVKKQTDKYIAGFVNAVLRKIAADTENTPPSNEFFPDSFFKLLRQSYSAKTIRKIEQAALAEPPLDISVKSNPETWAQTLGGIQLCGGTIRLRDAAPVPSLPGFNDGSWWVQDFAASLAVKSLLPDLAGRRILDVCAAPGGKTAQLLAAGAKVTALDISAARLKTLRQNLERLQMPAEQIICADALEYLEHFQDEPFDDILLDAPCSATGTLRRHPEIVHLKTDADIAKQALLQKQILRHVSKALKIGGRLVYCTCSLDKREGENQIRDFLRDNNNFSIIPIAIPGCPEELLTSEGFLRVLPCHLPENGGADGFFIALLQRTK